MPDRKGKYNLTSVRVVGKSIEMALTKECQPMRDEDYIDCRVTAVEACEDQQFAYAIRQCAQGGNRALIGPIELNEADVLRWSADYAAAHQATT